MWPRFRPAALAAVVFTASCLPCASAVEKPESRPTTHDADQAEPQKFLRFVQRPNDGSAALETAIVSYRDANGVELHLVAAVHVAEKDYYKQLAKTFETYDALLYELVKPKDGVVPGSKAPSEPGGEKIRGASVVGGLQSFMKNVLKLDFQLEAINYDRPNFIHADLDAETFNKMEAERGESLFGLMIRSVVQEMGRQAAGKGAPPITVLDLLVAMRSPDSAREYKMLLARQFESMEGQLADLEGEEGTVLIAERNKAAINVLRQSIKDGKRNIGIFYGAGHMRGLETIVTKQLGFAQTAVEWRLAWDMPALSATAPSDGKAH